MRISKSRLKKLIENYLLEQDEVLDEEGDDSAEGTDSTGDEMFDEEGEGASSETDDSGDEAFDPNPESSDNEEEPADEEPVEEPEPSIEWEKAKFEIELDGEKPEVQFYLDTDDKVKYKVDGEPRSNKTKLNFATIGGLAALSDNPDVRKAGEAIVKLDTTLKDKTIGMIRQTIKQKMNTGRKGFSVEDIRKALKP